MIMNSITYWLLLMSFTFAFCDSSNDQEFAKINEEGNELLDSDDVVIVVQRDEVNGLWFEYSMHRIKSDDGNLMKEFTVLRVGKLENAVNQIKREKDKLNLFPPKEKIMKEHFFECKINKKTDKVEVKNNWLKIMRGNTCLVSVSLRLSKNERQAKP